MSYSTRLSNVLFDSPSTNQSSNEILTNTTTTNSTPLANLIDNVTS